MAGIWTVAELIRRPDLLAKCQAEILGAISAVPPSAKQDQTPLSNLLNRPPATLPQLLPTINAAFQETLRFHTSSYSLRLVLTDTVLPASLLPGNQGSQYGYLLQAGDQVVCVSRHNQVWEGGDWGAEANIWNHKRFLDGERVEDKKGRGTMTPFGGGVSMVRLSWQTEYPIKADLAVTPNSAKVSRSVLMTGIWIARMHISDSS